MKWHRLLLIAACFVANTNAIFRDDAFHIDYHQALLGIPQRHTTFFHKPQSSSEASLLYTVSDRAVLGAVRPKDGTLLWRQTLAEQSVENTKPAYLAADQNGILYSGYNDKVIAWDALDGRLIWDFVLSSGYYVKGLQAIPSGNAEASQTVQHVVVLAGPERDSSGGMTVLRLGGDSMGTQWQYKDTSSTYDADVSIAVSPKHVFYISKSSGLLSGGKSKVVVLDVVTGAELNQYSVATDSKPLGDGGSYSTGSCSGSPVLVSSEKPYKSIKLNLLGQTKGSVLNIEDKGEEIQQLTVHASCDPGNSAHLLIHVKSKTKVWAEVFRINTKTGDATKIYSLPTTKGHNVFATGVSGETVYFARVTDTEITLYNSESSSQIGQWARAIAHNESAPAVLHATIDISTKGGVGIALRAALTSDGGEWSLIQNGEARWSRPEILAYITKAIWADDVVTSLLAQDIQAEAESNPVAAYVRRVSRHAQDLAYLPAYLISLPQAILQPNEDVGLSIRQKLVGGKLVLAVTSKNMVLAIDAAHGGQLRWRFDMSPHIQATVKPIHLSITDDRLTIYTSDGSVIVVNAVNGTLIEAVEGTSSASKLVELPGYPASTIVHVSENGVPEVFSKLAPAIPSEGNALMTINEKGEAVGWTIGTSVEETWTLRPPHGSRFVEAVGRSAHDPIASIGKVLGDRSVLYKYISPNLALLTALSSTTLTVYLINAVTGTVLHSSRHDGIVSKFPIPTLLSENWFAYSFTTKDAETSGILTQLIISELYESETANDRGPLSAKMNYSSFLADASAKPYVLSQAYTIPALISNLTATQTLQGITSRQILAILPELDALVSIPRDILDARRPTNRDVTAAEAEEGLTRYSPLIQLDTRFFLSHTRDVVGLKQIMTTPTLLESTSMVFAYGHDIFGTQVAPSNTFDVLGKGFNKVQLLLTVVALYAGVLLLRPVVRRKMVQTRYL